MRRIMIWWIRMNTRTPSAIFGRGEPMYWSCARYQRYMGWPVFVLGYAVTSPEIITALHTVKEPFAVNLTAQAAGIAALEDAAFLAETTKNNHEGRFFLYKQFERMGLFFLKSHANFVLVKIDTNAWEVQEKLLKRGVIVRPCSAYALPEYVRVSVGTAEQYSRFITVLRNVIKSVV